MIAGLCPIGSIIAWAKSFTGVPSLASQGRNEWVECNGQAYTDAQSPLTGNNLPDINNNSRFLRGQSTSGGTGGTDSTHTHTLTTNVSSLTTGQTVATGSVTGATDGRPAFYNVVRIIRTK